METPKEFTLVTAAILVVIILVVAVILVPISPTQNATPVASAWNFSVAPIGPMIAPSKAAPQEGTPVASGDVIVKFKGQGLTAPTTSDVASEVQKQVGATLVQISTVVPGLALVKLPAGASVDEAIAQYKKNPAVEGAWPNYEYTLSATPNDPFYSVQWGLNNTGQTIDGPARGAVAGTAGDDINVSAAWNATTGSSSVVVAVIDGGVQTDHPDLAANIGPGWNFAYNNSNPDPFPMNESFHGTHVAGIIGAVTNNSLGVAGVSPHVTIMPLQTADPRHPGEDDTYSVIQAIIYADQHGASIVNMSFGGHQYDDLLYQAMKNSTMLFVCAAGNDGTNNDLTPDYPASYGLPNIISVAASDSNGNLANFSNYGPASVDLAAPGVDIASTFYQYGQGYGYVYASGTSMAAPFVSGVAALVKAVHPNYGYAELKSAILSTTDAQPAFAGKMSTGGMLDAGKAVLYNSSATNNPRPSPSASPTPGPNDYSSQLNAFFGQGAFTLVTPFQRVVSGNLTGYVGAYESSQGNLYNATIIPTDSVATALGMGQYEVQYAQQHGFTQIQSNTTTWIGQNNNGQYMIIYALNIPALGGNPGLVIEVVTPTQQSTGSAQQASEAQISLPQVARVVAP
jgi:subtilisin family serine protease